MWEVTSVQAEREHSGVCGRSVAKGKGMISFVFVFLFFLFFYFFIFIFWLKLGKEGRLPGGDVGVTALNYH